MKIQISKYLAALRPCVIAVLTLAGASVNPCRATTIMPMGDSITRGIDYETNTSGGYRDPLYTQLTAAGLSFSFVGADTSLTTPALTVAGDSYHNGFGSWHIVDLNANIDGAAAPIAGGDSNDGGYLLTGGHGTGRAAICPDILLLHAGTNDILQGSQSIDSDLSTLVTHIHALCPATVELVAGIIPMNYPTMVPIEQAYNSYIKNTLVPARSYLRYVDMFSAFLNSDGSVNATLLGTDDVHPNKYGYPIMAGVWATAIKAVQGYTSPSFPLTIKSGAVQTQGGSTVSVVAPPPPAGYTFAGWTGATFANPGQMSTTLLMPSAATTITANYSANPASYLLTVNSGTGSGAYTAGANVTITANPPQSGYQFAAWTGATSAIASVTSSTTTLLMPNMATTVTATYSIKATGSSSGIFAMLNESSTQGNALANDYGVSQDGNGFTTYWYQNNNIIKVLSMGHNQFELIEQVGQRCLTVSGAAVSMYACSGSAGQLFALNTQSDGSYTVQSGGSCVRAASSFTRLDAQPCGVTLDQRWVFSGSTPLSTVTGH
ncbi:MAG TPA: SGNH/GDSL hydrolase family protein [Acidisarcina sp.]